MDNIKAVAPLSVAWNNGNEETSRSPKASRCGITINMATTTGISIDITVITGINVLSLETIVLIEIRLVEYFSFNIKKFVCFLS